MEWKDFSIGELLRSAEFASLLGITAPFEIILRIQRDGNDLGDVPARCRPDAWSPLDQQSRTVGSLSSDLP